MTAINLLDVADYLRRHGRRVLLWAVAFAVLGYLGSFLIPPTYRASAVILPPDEDELTTSLSLTRRGLSGLGRLGGPYFTQADIALAILRSRGVAQQIASDLDLRKAYGAKDPASAVDLLRERTRVRIANDGTISVTVEDGDAARSAELANRYLSELDRRNQRFRSAQARRTRQFLEQRVVEADSMLHHTERLAAAYQSRRGAVLITTEGQAAANAAATLMTQKVTAQLELEQVVDAVARLLPGVLGDFDSAESDSFHQGLLDCAYYTRPATFRGWPVPDVLVSGDHGRIARWRRENALRRTRERRPDLLATAPLDPADRKYLETLTGKKEK